MPSRTDEGFSLIELMTVVLILGILVTVAIVSYTFSAERSAAIACEANRRILQDAANVYESEELTRIKTIEDLRPYVKNLDTVIVCPADPEVDLMWDGAAREIVSPLHP